MRVIVTSPGKGHQHFGACIYCGEPAPTREHIIPRGLGGNHTLLRSSCLKCRDITRDIETYLQRTMFGSFRVRFGLNQTEPQGTFPLHIIDDSGRISIVRREPRQYPRILALARWPSPGILLNRPIDEAVPTLPFLATEIFDRNEIRSTHGGQGYMSPEIHPVILARSIAKIGLSAAFALVGTGQFKPLVCSFIIEGPTPHPYHFFGGGAATLELPEPNVLHRVSLRWDRQFLVADVRLFAFVGTPIFEVVVGERIENECAAVQQHSNRGEIRILFKSG